MINNPANSAAAFATSGVPSCGDRASSSPHTATESRRAGMVPRRAFTLIELLVVIGVIAVLIAIVIPALSLAKKSATRTICLGNQREIMKGVMDYAIQYRGKLPYSGRQFPYMAMMDFYETLMSTNMCQTVKYAHCPGDNFTPGYWAQWWLSFGPDGGQPMSAGDHLPQVQPLITSGLIPANANYSYFWATKMYNLPTGCDGLASLSITDALLPQKLSVLQCRGEYLFMDNMAGGTTRINTAFMDGHAETVPWAVMYPVAAPVGRCADGSVNTDWTSNGSVPAKCGITGYDVP
jgi:prepilin-type N-terminal cleavage/methylation domain-containing protein/prepilin-type processing-associated H-X9-DG protein